MQTLKEGDQAPDFNAHSSDGKTVRLSDLRGKNVVLYFYPKDDTPGCTIEAKEFTEAIDRFSSSDTQVFGVSYDDAECHKAFIDKYNLKISLLVDDGGKIAKSYESAGDNGYAKRNTFVIDKNGRIKKIYEGVKPQGHASDVLSVLQ